MLLLWEEAMAETVANFAQDPNNADSKLIVLAGGFHVQYGFGIPKRAFRRIPHSYAIILPTVTELPSELKDREMDVQHVSIPLYAADYAWKVQYKVLPKNKMMLGVVLENTENAVRIISVSSNSNADQAGFKDGDLLLAMEENELTDIEDFIEELKEYKIGDKVTFLIKRGEKEIKVEVRFREQKL
jgi:predicted metalloprotease with PDZ domain